MQVSKTALISNPRTKSAVISMVTEHLEDAGFKVIFDPVSAEKVGRDHTHVKDMDGDVALVFGGDGTLLWAAGNLNPSIPLLGVNTGRFGYLTESGPESVLSHLDELASGDFALDSRMKLSFDEGADVLNEVLVCSKEPASLLEFRLFLNGVEASVFRADAVMVSTPTGSTGYCISAGGSLLHPLTQAYIITPVNPFLRKQFPIVVPSCFETKIELVRKDRQAKLIADGRVNRSLSPGDVVTVKESENKAMFVRFSDEGGCSGFEVNRLK